MPIPQALVVFLADQATAAASKLLQGVFAKAPWARDRAVSQTVERKIHGLVERVAELARNVPPDRVDAMMEPLIQTFRGDLIEAKLSATEADEVVATVRGQINTTVLAPLRDVTAIQARLTVLETENTELTERLTNLEREKRDLSDRVLALHSVRTLAIIALVLGSLAILISFVAVLRR